MTPAGRIKQGRRTAALRTLCSCFVVMGWAQLGPGIATADATEQTIRARGIELAKVARSRAKAKSFTLAAQMFHEAYDIDRAEWRYLFSAARCEQLAGLMSRAEGTYARFLKVSPTDHPLRMRAGRELTAVHIERAKQQAVQRAAQLATGMETQRKDRKSREIAALKSKARSDAANRAATSTATSTATGLARTTGADASPVSSTWHAPVGWGGVIVGVLAAGVGGALYGLALADKGRLEKEVGDGLNAAGKVTSLSFDAAQARKTEIDGRLMTWGPVAAAGIGVAVVGAIVLALAPARVIGSGSTVGALQTSIGPRGSWRIGWMVRF